MLIQFSTTNANDELFNSCSKEEVTAENFNNNEKNTNEEKIKEIKEYIKENDL
jgi:hypothetical protein